ncbi:MAG TPA: multiheme c-type cytochrome [Blastocatellia bacterium]
MQKLIRLTLVLAAFALALSGIVPEEWLAWARSEHPPAPQASAPHSRYVGAQTCAACHTEIAAKLPNAVMTKALEKADSCQILRDFPDLKFQLGKFNFRIERQGDKSIYTISDGKNEISAPLQYCFGQGKAGQTYVYEYNGMMFESRVSFYREIKGLDITLGYAHEVPQTLTEAAGRQMSVDETRRCFGCHTTGAGEGSQFRIAHAVPGVNCESCHGPGDQHVAAMRAGDKTAGKAKIKKLTNLDGDDITQSMCGSCHRSVEDVMALPQRGGISNVRFQPYRIFNSRCYSADKRIGCTACHDPHDSLEQSAAFFDSKCLACHQSVPEAKTAAKPALAASNSGDNARSARACTVGKKDCTVCHMPKIDLPGAHFKFTDHRIRIVREGAPFPN